MSLKFLLILSLFFSFSNMAKCQDHLQDVNLDSINFIKVREYIKNQIETNHQNFSDLEASLNPLADVGSYFSNLRNYRIKENIDNVWPYYANVSPQKAWNCQRINFGLLFSKNRNKLHYAGAKIEKIERGQIVFLNLKLLKGVYNLAVGFEITSIDNENRIIEFSYLKGNQSEGKQQLRFIDSGNGQTLIEHRSFYKSHSFIRDILLYPYFHTKITNSFHRNMRNNLINSMKYFELDNSNQ